MKATIWHNPQCSKSRAALETLRARGDIELEVVEYLKAPPGRDKLAQLYRDAGIAPREGLRTYGTDAKERGLTEADDETVLEAMAADPKLIERPLVETEKGVRLCRPPDPRPGRLPLDAVGQPADGDRPALKVESGGNAGAGTRDDHRVTGLAAGIHDQRECG